MAKKKDDFSIMEYVWIGTHIVGGLLFLACIVPQLPWRYARISASMGQRFAMDRQYSLLHLGDQFGKAVSWMKMRKDVCLELTKLNQPNPIGTLIGVVAGGVGAGGAIGGCASWPPCKEHAVLRCSAYTTLAITGLLSVILLLGSAICAFITPKMILDEKKVLSKKKKLAAAQSLTMIMTIASFVPGFLGSMVWIFLSDSTFKGLATRAAYPYPAAHVGVFMSEGACFILFINMCAGINRSCKLIGYPKKEGDDEEEEAYAAEAEGPAGAEALLPGMQPGIGGMGDNMGGPPGMDLPGMGEAPHQ